MENEEELLCRLYNSLTWKSSLEPNVVMFAKFIFRDGAFLGCFFFYGNDDTVGKHSLYKLLDVY